MKTITIVLIIFVSILHAQALNENTLESLEENTLACRYQKSCTPLNPQKSFIENAIAQRKRDRTSQIPVYSCQDYKYDFEDQFEEYGEVMHDSIQEFKLLYADLPTPGGKGGVFKAIFNIALNAISVATAPLGITIAGFGIMNEIIGLVKNDADRIQSGDVKSQADALSRVLNTYFNGKRAKASTQYYTCVQKVSEKSSKSDKRRVLCDFYDSVTNSYESVPTSNDFLKEFISEFLREKGAYLRITVSSRGGWNNWVIRAGTRNDIAFSERVRNKFGCLKLADWDIRRFIGSWTATNCKLFVEKSFNGCGSWDKCYEPIGRTRGDIFGYKNVNKWQCNKCNWAVPCGVGPNMNIDSSFKIGYASGISRTTLSGYNSCK